VSTAGEPLTIMQAMTSGRLIPSPLLDEIPSCPPSLTDSLLVCVALLVETA